jgi:hypothetical protein
MHLEAAMVQLRDALGGRDRASVQVHLEAMIDRNWRIWSRSIEGVPGADTLSIS